MVFNRADGGVSIAGSNDKAISAMTGEGGLVAGPTLRVRRLAE